MGPFFWFSVSVALIDLISDLHIFCLWLLLFQAQNFCLEESGGDFWSRLFGSAAEEFYCMAANLSIFEGCSF